MKKNVMPRKVVQGPIRDKEKTKKKLLDAVGEILKTKGYRDLKVSKIAVVAGYDKKLIYEYFGSTDKLINEYLRSQNYYGKVDDTTPDMGSSGSDQKLLVNGLLKIFDGLLKNKELQKVLIWELSENRPALKSLVEKREEIAHGLSTHSEKVVLDDKSDEFKSILALVLAGIYHLNLYTGSNASVFCGIDLKSEGGRGKIEQAIINIMDFAYTR
nr:TetR/AcrR family transcriptional regulator [uncultured Chryseobacterium sp.]